MEDNITKLTTIKTHTGRSVPAIGYGTYQLKGADCVKGVLQALEAGYIHIDTASIYKNEDDIQKALQKSNRKRQELFITSKISPAQQGFDEAINACNKILSKLGCQYLDLLLIHWPGVSKEKAEGTANKKIRLRTWKALIQLKKQGKVREIGVSNFLVRHLQHLIKNSEEKPAVNQFQAHPLLWQGDTIDFCRKNGIVIEAYSPLARGDEKLFKNKKMLQLSQQYKKSIAQLSLRWALQHGFVVLPKSKCKDRIIENLDIFDFVIAKQDMAKIDQLKKADLHTCWDPQTIKF